MTSSTDDAIHSMPCFGGGGVLRFGENGGHKRMQHGNGTQLAPLLTAVERLTVPIPLEKKNMIKGPTFSTLGKVLSRETGTDAARPTESDVADVQHLQMLLNGTGCVGTAPVSIDGVYGPLTTKYDIGEVWFLFCLVISLAFGCLRYL